MRGQCRVSPDYPTYKARSRQSGKRSKTYPAGRRCQDCETILSIYNPQPTCQVHTPRRKPRLKGRKEPVS